MDVACLGTGARASMRAERMGGRGLGWGLHYTGAGVHPVGWLYREVGRGWRRGRREGGWMQIHAY